MLSNKYANGNRQFFYDLNLLDASVPLRTLRLYHTRCRFSTQNGPINLMELSVPLASFPLAGADRLVRDCSRLAVHRTGFHQLHADPVGIMLLLRNDPSPAGICT
jgi:hypothetical protein